MHKIIVNTIHLTYDEIAQTWNVMKFGSNLNQKCTLNLMPLYEEVFTLVRPT